MVNVNIMSNGPIHPLDKALIPIDIINLFVFCASFKNHQFLCQPEVKNPRSVAGSEAMVCQGQNVFTIIIITTNTITNAINITIVKTEFRTFQFEHGITVLYAWRSF